MWMTTRKEILVACCMTSEKCGGGRDEARADAEEFAAVDEAEVGAVVEAEVDAGRVVEAEVDAERIAAVGEGEELAAVDGAEAPTLAAAGEGEADAEQRGRPGRVSRGRAQRRGNAR